MQQSISRLASSLKFTALAAFFGAVGLASGCSSGEEKCGGVEVDGKCYARCSDDQCVEGNRCVPDQVTGIAGCVPPCGIQDDCELGTNCVTVTFGEADSGAFCVALLGGKTGQGDECTSNEQCDTRRGWECADGTCKKLCEAASDCAKGELCQTVGSVMACVAGPCDCDFGAGEHCVAGECVTTCAGHADCGDGELCTTAVTAEDTDDPINTCKPGPCTSNANCDIQPGYHCIDSECVQAECVEHSNCEGGICKTGGTDADGGTVNYCTEAPGEKRGPGEFGSACPQGAADCASGFLCFGRGEGDAYSYCTQFDCTQDSDCATGFHCGRIRVGDTPCEDTCSGIPADSAAGCVPAGDIGADKKYTCGALNLMRNVCKKNDYCAECETDEDCLGEANQICAKGPDGNKQCTVTCDPTVDSCPWGAASECKVFDTDRGVATCGHKYGACTGTGQGCEPCVDDDDCGAQGICVDSSFTGEKFCLDLSLDCDCTGLPASADIPQACKGGGCPTTPGGLQMYCFGLLNDPTNPLNNKCYGANSNTQPFSSPQMGCYPN